MTLADYFTVIDLPADIDPLTQRLLSELQRMLDRIDPGQLDRSRSSIEPGVEGISIELSHRSHPDLKVGLEVFGEEVVVNYGEQHEHFDVEHEIAEFAVGPFATDDFVMRVIAFLETLITGRVELHVTHRLFFVRTRSYWINDDGKREQFLSGGTVIPTLRWSKAPIVRTFDFT